MYVLNLRYYIFRSNRLQQVSDNHIQAAEMILRLVQTISENMPRFNVYEELLPDPALDVALLQIFTDVVEFSVLSLRYFERRRLGQ